VQCNHFDSQTAPKPVLHASVKSSLAGSPHETLVPGADQKMSVRMATPFQSATKRHHQLMYAWKECECERPVLCGVWSSMHPHLALRTRPLTPSLVAACRTSGTYIQITTMGRHRLRFLLHQSGEFRA
jgi:hypothetical protein